MRKYVKWKALPHIKALMFVACASALLLVWAMTGSVTWAQTPRPTLTPGPPSTATPEPRITETPAPTPTSAAKPQASSGYTGPLLRGQVLDLTTGEPTTGVKVVFTTGDVSVEVVSDENGEYAFQHLGTANGVLNVVPSQESGLRPATVDVAVQPKTGVETVVNLGVSPNASAGPPLNPTVELSPSYVSAGDSLTITVVVKNTRPQAISGATVTNWLPDRLVPVSIHSSTGNPYFSDKLAVADLGTLDAGSGAMVEIVARVAGGGRTSATVLKGNVSFFYREDAAGQAPALYNGEAPTVLPVTGVGLPLAGLGLIIVVFAAGLIRRRLRRTEPSSDGVR